MFNYPAGKDIRIFHMRGLIEVQGENALSEMEKVKKDALSKELGIAFAGSAVQHAKSRSRQTMLRGDRKNSHSTPSPATWDI